MNEAEELQRNINDIESIRKILTGSHGRLDRLKSYAKAKPSNNLIPFSNTSEIFHRHVYNEKGKIIKAVYQSFDQDGKFLCYTVSPTEGHGWTFDLKTREEALAIRQKRKLTDVNQTSLAGWPQTSA